MKHAIAILERELQTKEHNQSVCAREGRDGEAAVLGESISDIREAIIRLTAIKEEPKTSFLFEEFIQHGIDQGAPLTRGMPWSFDFHGYPATHETDDLYIVSGARFPREGIITILQGGFQVTIPEQFPHHETSNTDS